MCYCDTIKNEPEFCSVWDAKLYANMESGDFDAGTKLLDISILNLNRLNE